MLRVGDDSIDLFPRYSNNAFNFVEPQCSVAREHDPGYSSETTGFRGLDRAESRSVKEGQAELAAYPSSIAAFADHADAADINPIRGREQSSDSVFDYRYPVLRVAQPCSFGTLGK